ncbi:MAG: ELWxxDGT repeat protein [Pseudomonadota bacterium]
MARVIFSATNGSGIRDLYFSDGIAGDPTAITRLDIGINFASVAAYSWGGKTLFRALSASNDSELYITDGTAAGTRLLKDINTGGSSSPQGFAQVFDKVVFAATGAEGRELWVTDGTTVGTKLLKDINPGAGSSLAATVQMASLYDKVFFTADNGVNGAELWVTDGTTAGTVMVKDIVAGANGSSITGLTAYPFVNKVVFSANDGVNGLEPWVSDGTAAGTFQLANLAASGGSSPTRFTWNEDGKIVFAATVAGLGTELYVTDGTTAGTRLVMDINPGAASGLNTNEFYHADNGVYFNGNDGVTGSELWSYSFGTVTRLTDINPGSGSANPNRITAYAGDTAGVLFSAFNGTSGTELWSVNGNGQVALVSDLTPGAGSTALVGLVLSSGANDGLVFFQGSPASTNSEPYVTNGSTAGTYRLADINPGAGSSFPVFLAINEGLISRDDAVSTAENTTIKVDVYANDSSRGGISYINGQQVTSRSITLPSGAIVTLEDDFTLSYNPNGKFTYLVSAQTAATNPSFYSSTATDSFSYSVGGTAAALVTITLNGSDGTGDQVRASSGNDTVTTGSGAETIDVSQGGDDTVSAGGGNDGIFFGAAFGAGDVVDGGSGNDQMALSGTYSNLNITAGQITNVEVIALQPGAGNSYTITLEVGVIAAGQTMTFYGGLLDAGQGLNIASAVAMAGGLNVYGGKGTDIIVGGSGDDGFFFGPGKFDPTVDRVNGGAGTNDQLALDGDYTLTLDGTAIQNVEVIVLLEGPAFNKNDFNLTLADSFVPTGETRTINGALTSASMIVNGSGETNGNLILTGGRAADTLTSGSGADVLFGGLGGDTLAGGTGADIFRYTNVAQSTSTGYDRITDFVYGTDTIDLPGTHDSYVRLQTGSLSTATFDANLQSLMSGVLVAGGAVVFTASAGTLSGATFVVVDDNGIAGYQAGSDYVIRIDGTVPTAIPDFIV